VKAFRAPRLAFDRAEPAESSRRYDVDGRLHVADAILTASEISPYLGSEIPGADALGLDPDKIYGMLRPPEEIVAALDSYNALPVLSRHVKVSASDHRPDDVVGASGSDARFDFPFLTNSLVIWSQDAIDKIESGAKKSLSCAYRYTPVMGDGVWQGAPFAGRMTKLAANHIALVIDPRVTSAVIGDARPRRPGDAAREFRRMFPSVARRV